MKALIEQGVDGFGPVLLKIKLKFHKDIVEQSAKFMQKFKVVLGISLIAVQVLLASVSSAMGTSSSDLEGKWGLEFQDRKSVLDLDPEEHPNLPVDLGDTLKDHQVFFVAGMWNEICFLVTSYWGAAMEAASELGMDSSRYFPKSWHFNANVEEVKRRVFELYHNGTKTPSGQPKKIFLVGHSKGGLEVVVLVLKHPELIYDGIVTRVVSLQGALHGTPLASKGTLSFPLSSMKRLATTVLGEGIAVVDPEITERTLMAAYDSFLDYTQKRYPTSWQEKVSEFHQKVFYVPTYETERKNRTLSTVSCHLLLGDHLMEKRSDGLLRVEDQIFSKIGIALKPVRADHNSLVLTHGFYPPEGNRWDARTTLEGYFDSIRPLARGAGFELPKIHDTVNEENLIKILLNTLGGHTKERQSAFFRALFMEVLDRQHLENFL